MRSYSAALFSLIDSTIPHFPNPKFQFSSHLQWLHSPVCVRLVRNPEDRFSHNEAQIEMWVAMEGLVPQQLHDLPFTYVRIDNKTGRLQLTSSRSCLASVELNSMSWLFAFLDKTCPVWFRFLSLAYLSISIHLYGGQDKLICLLSVLSFLQLQCLLYLQSIISQIDIFIHW